MYVRDPGRTFGVEYCRVGTRTNNRNGPRTVHGGHLANTVHSWMYTVFVLFVFFTRVSGNCWGSPYHKFKTMLTAAQIIPRHIVRQTLTRIQRYDINQIQIGQRFCGIRFALTALTLQENNFYVISLSLSHTSTMSFLFFVRVLLP
jgi:hypothetical protein